MLSDQNAVYNIIMPNITQFFQMILKNIFRPLPVIKKTNVPGELGMEEEDVIIDPSWPHLQVRIFVKGLTRCVANLRALLPADS